MISGGGEGLSLYSKPPPPSPPFHSSLYLLSQSAVTHNEARVGDGANREAETATAAQTTVARGPADHSGNGTYFSIMLRRPPLLAVPCASHSKRAVYYSMMCLPIQWSRKAREVTDSNDVTCVPANDSPQGEVLESAGELFSGAGHSRSVQEQAGNSRAYRKCSAASQEQLPEQQQKASLIGERKLAITGWENK